MFNFNYSKNYKQYMINLTDKQKKELKEYIELEKMKKKYYGYLAAENFK